LTTHTQKNFLRERMNDNSDSIVFLVKKPAIPANVNPRKFWELYNVFLDVYGIKPDALQFARSISHLFQLAAAALEAKHAIECKRNEKCLLIKGKGKRKCAEEIGLILTSFQTQLHRKAIPRLTLLETCGDVNTIAEEFKFYEYNLCQDPRLCDPTLNIDHGHVKICDVCMAYPLFMYYKREKIELCTSCYQTGSAHSNSFVNRLNDFKQLRDTSETYY